MKFLVAKQDLKAALDTVAPAISTTTTDKSSHYLFRRPLNGNMDRIEVLTHNGRLAARSQFIAAVEETSTDPKSWSFTIEGWRLGVWLQSKEGAGTLSFSYDVNTKVVTVVATDNKKHKPSEWESLDPDDWPYWDEMYAASKVTSKINTGRLAHILKFSKTFASQDDTNSPEYCLCEVRSGVMTSADRRGASLVYSPLWGNSTIRVHIRDIPSIVSFLEKHESEDVEVFEGPNTNFFRCEDQLFVESKPIHVFPHFNHPADNDQRWWVINTNELMLGVKHLVSSAESITEPRLIFNRPDPTGPILMTMHSAMSEKMSTVELDVLESGEFEDGSEPIPDLPPEGFMVARPRLEDVMNLYKEDTLRIGINRTKKNGYIRFSKVQFEDEDGQNGDNFITIMSWLKK